MPSEAISPLQKAGEIDPEFDQAHFALGNAFRMLGRFDDATREWDICKQIKARKDVRGDTTK